VVVECSYKRINVSNRAKKKLPGYKAAFKIKLA